MTIVSGGLDRTLALVAERAAGASDARRLDDDVVGAIAATGVTRMLLPEELGGDAADPRLVIDAVARIAAVDGSAGWCTSITTGSKHFAGYVGEGAARASFADPDAGAASIFAPMGVIAVSGDGRATLTGRWAFASNCVHSRWIGLGAMVEDAAGNRAPFPRLVFVSADDVVVEDTWHGAGLRATGSHHVRVEGVPVDLERSCSFADRPWAEGPLWRMPLFSVLSPVLVAVPLGIARGVLDHLQAQLRSGDGQRVRGALADDPVALADLGAADAALRAARAGLLDALGRSWEVAVAGDRPSRPLQAQLILAVLHTCDTAVAVTSTVHRLCGGSAAFVGHPVLQALRDAETARQHILFSHQHRPVLSRIAAGMDEVAPPFVT